MTVEYWRQVHPGHEHVVAHVVLSFHALRRAEVRRDGDVGHTRDIAL